MCVLYGTHDNKEGTCWLPLVPVLFLDGCGDGFRFQNGAVMGRLCCGGDCSTEKEDEEKGNITETEAKEKD
jgi:hypothetical protein